MRQYIKQRLKWNSIFISIQLMSLEIRATLTATMERPSVISSTAAECLNECECDPYQINKINK